MQLKKCHKEIHQCLCYEHSAQVKISGSAFKAIFKVNITNYKSRSEVYNVEFYVLYYDSRY